MRNGIEEMESKHEEEMEEVATTIHGLQETNK